jgi:hypothetical protein
LVEVKKCYAYNPPVLIPLEVVDIACAEVLVGVGVVGDGATFIGTLLVVGSGVEVAGDVVGVRVEVAEVVVGVGVEVAGVVVGVGAEAVEYDEGSSSQSPSSLPPVDTGSPLLHVIPAGIWHSEGSESTLSLA